MSYEIVSTGDPYATACATCKGIGTIGDGYCWTCHGDGTSFFDQSALYTLAHNLAVAAALCRSFELGRDLQHVLTNADWQETRLRSDRERAEAFREYFHPGCGRSAP